MEGNFRIGHVSGHVIEMLPTADVGVVEIPHSVSLVLLQLHVVVCGVQIHFIAVVRPVHELDLAVLEVERIVGHVKRADGGDLPAERPQHVTIVAQTNPEVPRVRGVVERVCTANLSTWKCFRDLFRQFLRSF